jgi:multiple sugar transport system substrate-binding protein
MKRSVTRRQSVASLAALSTGALAACGQAGGTTGTGQPAGGGDSAATGKVSWMHSEGSPPVVGFDRIESAFKAKYPNVTLDILQITDGYDDKLLTMYSAGNPPDVLRLNDDYILAYKTKNLIAALDGYMKTSGIKKDDFYSAIINFPVYENKTYSWFMGINPRLIYYNVGLFKQNGVKLPPAKWQKTGWTFDDLVDTAKRLTQPGSPGLYGAALYDDTGNEQTFSMNNGSPTGIFSKDGRTFTLADPPGYEAIQWIADLANKHRVQPTRQVANDNKGTDDMFINQQLAMRFTTTGFINRIRRDAPSLEFDVTPVPMKTVRLGEGSIQTYALAVGAKNPDNGWRLLNFFTEQDAAHAFIDTGYVIPAKKTFAKDYVAASKGKPPANMALIVEALDYQTQPNQTLDTPAARSLYRGTNLNDIWDGKVTAKDGLNRVRAQVEAAIAPK